MGLFGLFCIGLSVLLHNPQLTSSLFTTAKGILKTMTDTSNLISWLSLIGTFFVTVSAIASAVAAWKASNMAESSRDIAKNALRFQYQDLIKESIKSIVDTLISEQTINVNPTEIISVCQKNHTVSLERTDWIFAAQEVKNIITQIEAIAIDETDKNSLMERYGRILEKKLSVVNGKKGETLFTSKTPNNNYMNTIRSQKDIRDKQLSIRNKDMFVIYLFTEEYTSYIPGSGQYPTRNKCNYFNELPKSDLS